MRNITKILFVCTGNTARSPAAEYLAKYYAKKAGLDIKFESAGFINAFSYMQPESRKFLDKMKIDHSDFSPQLVSGDLIKKHDLIITMERSHKTRIINTYSQLGEIQKKTYTLKEFTGASGSLDIEDPYYTSSSRYREILNAIDENIKKLMQIFKEENQNITF
ncbi:MAG: Low molecular weight protein-tyrosine-phosphatase [Promethearchaeota archaeon]|jgi:protein-tyrosine phosphatase|nr:MAG: Low molecular weight protein-tyrosine-phosphatase [Candidatus Lokiarchaeota archaeon]